MNYGELMPSSDPQHSPGTTAPHGGPAPKSDVTHTDFMNFLGPFFDSISRAKYNELVAQHAETGLGIESGLYRKFSSHLKSRLCACYKFDQSVEIEDVSFEKELVLLNKIEFKGDEISFFDQKAVLSEFEACRAHSERESLRRQIVRNNRMRRAIGAAVTQRAVTTGYFQAYDLIHKELDAVYRKMRLKKRKKQCDIEDETIREYLDRMREFVGVFGVPGQFPADAYVYPDILDECEDDDHFVYLP